MGLGGVEREKERERKRERERDRKWGKGGRGEGASYHQEGTVAQVGLPERLPTLHQPGQGRGLGDLRAAFDNRQISRRLLLVPLPGYDRLRTCCHNIIPARQQDRVKPRLSGHHKPVIALFKVSFSGLQQPSIPVGY